MENETTGENQETNQENDEQKIERLRNERNGLKKNTDTLKAQKSHWKKKAEAKSEKTKDKPREKSSNTDDARDIAIKTFLEGRDIKDIDDQKIVIDEAKRLKMSETEVVEMEHIKLKLKDAKDQRNADEGTPKGKGSSKGKVKSDVGYWVDKKDKDGSFMTPDDQDLADKVIQARIDKEEKSGKFSDQLY